MTLSGYLFAKLLADKQIDYRYFLWNRFVRLAPLLTVVIAVVGVIRYTEGTPLGHYASSILKGLVTGRLPNGGWSIVVEFHFYLLLPIFLWMFRKSKILPFSIIIVALCIRMLIFFYRGEIQTFAYWTILGRVDQFALGMLSFQLRDFITRKHLYAFITLSSFLIFYWYFNNKGGFYKLPSYPSPTKVWIAMSTIEGSAYAFLISWYDTSFKHSNSNFSEFIGKIGEVSYSIYIIHFFFVFHAARFIHENVMKIDNFYLACCWSAIFFLCMLPLGILSFRFIETPFLKLRRPYVLAPYNKIPSNPNQRSEPL